MEEAGNFDYSIIGSSASRGKPSDSTDLGTPKGWISIIFPFWLWPKTSPVSPLQGPCTTLTFCGVSPSRGDEKKVGPGWFPINEHLPYLNSSILNRESSGVN